MKLLGSVLLVLFKIEFSRAYSTSSLEYVLQAIEYLSSERSGVFSCVFYDIGPKNPFDNLLNDVMQSPRLNHVVKYVIHGSYNESFEMLPWHPKVLIVHPGHDLDHLKSIKWEIARVLKLFNPTTKVLGLVNFSNRKMSEALEEFIFFCKFTYAVYLDIATMQVRQCNGFHCWNRKEVPELKLLFTFGQRSMEGRNITYFMNELQTVHSWNLKWIREVARSLNTEAVPYRHDCKGSGQEYNKCMAEYRNYRDSADIVFSTMTITGVIPRDFRQLFTSIPFFVRILVPRERLYNTFELMLMPFTSHVWILLATILVSAEFAKHLFPELLKNDPILLVVCGFERHILHRANRWERTIFISLIVLMFFMSHAFETKIISLMISKPSVQRVKTLEDLYASGIKMYADLESNPHYRDHPVIGRLVVQGTSPGIGENIPGIALTYISEWIDLVLELSFDHTRMQPFYAPLDYLDFASCELYRTSTRSLFLEVFRRVHLALVEAGLVDLWKRQYSDGMRAAVRRDRPKSWLDVRFEGDLDFDDMKVAWLVLGFGAASGLVCFAGELIGNRFDSRWVGMVVGWIKCGKLAHRCRFRKIKQPEST